MMRHGFLLAFGLLPLVAAAQAPGYADLVFTNDFNNTGGFNQTCRNGGTGIFTCAATVTPADRRRGRGIAAADLDGDGDDDLAVAMFGSSTISAANRVCLNGGGGAFTCADVSADAEYSKDVAAADLDGDGDVDLAFANASATSGGALNRVCFNGGAGTFTCAAVSPDLDRSFAVVAADVDGDGDRDLVFGNSGAGTAGAVNRLCRNSGTGAFACAPLGTDIAATTGLAAADLDGDGDADLVVTTFFSPDRVCRNSGTGTFTCANVDADAGDTYAVATLDADRDGDLDLAFGTSIANNQARTSKLCLNSGAATFTCAPLSPDTDDAQDIAAGDMDGDGDPDLVIATVDFFTGGTDRGQNRLCRNSGTGVFTCEDLSPVSDDSYGVAVGNFGGRAVAGETPPGAGGLALTAAPNPSRGATTLALSLDAAETAVSVSVFDVLGRRVAVLHDGPLAAGDHAFRLDAAALPAGVYVVRATGGDAVATRRLTVVR